MFTVELLPARRGDCIWIEYGKGNARRRVLIDGGLISTYRDHLRERIEALPRAQRRFELLVVTHIDLDHIAGILELLRDPPDGLEFGDVWFNGWKHLVEDPGAILGPKQGEALSAWLEERGYKWNHSFGGGAVAIPDGGPLPTIRLDGGMTLTLLSPSRQRLRELAPVWEDEIRKAGLEPGEAGWELEAIAHPEDEDVDPGVLGDDRDIEELADSPFVKDRSEANGTSIAFLAEFEEKKAVFTGDAFANDVAGAVRRLLAERNEEMLEVDALKLSHHGGRKNTSAELLRLLKCKRYLFSTDGSNYKHPDRESVARALFNATRPPKPAIVFNYRTKQTEYWDDADMNSGDYSYDASFPQNEGAKVEL